MAGAGHYEHAIARIHILFALQDASVLTVALYALCLEGSGEPDAARRVQAELRSAVRDQPEVLELIERIAGLEKA